MKTKPSLKNVLLLTLFISIIGINVFEMSWNATFYPKYAVPDNYNNHLTITFWAVVFGALLLGLIVVPLMTSRNRKKYYLTFGDKMVLCCFFYFTLFLIIDPSISYKFLPGSSYLAHIYEKLHNLPIFIFLSFILLPSFILIEDYKPWHAFSGGIILGFVVLIVDIFLTAIFLGESLLSNIGIDFRNPMESIWWLTGKYLFMIPLCGMSCWIAHLYYRRQSQAFSKKEIAVFEIVSVYFCKFGKVNFLSGIVA